MSRNSSQLTFLVGTQITLTRRLFDGTVIILWSEEMPSALPEKWTKIAFFCFNLHKLY